MDKSSKEDDAVAWHAVNALIQDAKSNFRGEQQEAFALPSTTLSVTPIRRRSKIYATTCVTVE
jgi:hypothetical protein